MKHPALVRVFAVVLAIMSVISCAAGAVGFSDAKKERDDGASYGDKLDKRLENYRQLKEELDGSISYDEAMEQLEQLQEQHDSDAAQHRTDLATYSASRGGYKMGADALWEAKAQIAGAKQMIAEAKPMVEKLESAKAAMQGAIAQCDSAAASCNACIASLDGVMGVIAQKPTAPTEPDKVPVCEEPEPIEEPVAPTEPVREDYEDENLYNQALEKYNTDLAAYEAERAKYDEYLEKKSAYDAYVIYQEEYNTYLADCEKYQSDMNTWQAELAAASASVDTGACQAALQGGYAVLQGIQSILPGGADSGMGALPGAGPGSGAETDPITALTNLYTQLQAMSYGLGQASAGLDQAIKNMDSQFMSAMSQSGMDLPKGLSPSELIAYAEKQVAEGEFEIQKNLENIWYELGELEKDKEKLEEDKGLLDEEASKLGKMIVSTDELEQLNKKFKSAKAVLTNIGVVKTAVDAGESLEDAAADYIAQYRAQTKTRFDTRCAICILAVAAGITGLAVIPAAFEKTKKRGWLIVPAVLCLLCAAAAELLCAASDLGQHYVSIFMAVFAALYLLAALPKNRTGAAAK